jgi:hypothetical protein
LFPTSRDNKTFSATTGTPLYRRHYEALFISQMIALLAFRKRNPRQAIVVTYDIDERTLADWQQSAGQSRICGIARCTQH